MDESVKHYYRLLGNRDGLATAIIALHNFQMSIAGPGGAYLPPKHHKRRRAAALARVADLKSAEDQLRRSHERVRAALKDLPEPKP